MSGSAHAIVSGNDTGIAGRANERGTAMWRAPRFPGASLQMLHNVYGHHHPDLGMLLMRYRGNDLR